ncbi:hypothetical protein PISMIDRAFT_652300 [Pisolithus microcarpus 441]|uniref:DDE Tnp4 domain-containing protein n=1 Tax=Pisolithus microcarpus 441 TaxID=765257 RepID=A0A0C9Z887_9AGAM|nr:hypothetical protein PISMIDRAFT_652300 [Pisolithus microcarpus 441]
MEPLPHFILTDPSSQSLCRKTTNSAFVFVLGFFLVFLPLIHTLTHHSEHFYGLLKGHFQSLQEMHFQIQNQQDLNFTNMWIQCCLILHNLILEIEEDLGMVSSNLEYIEEAAAWGGPLTHEEDNSREDFISTLGQLFHNSLMECLFCRLNT